MAHCKVLGRLVLKTRVSEINAKNLARANKHLGNFRTDFALSRSISTSKSLADYEKRRFMHSNECARELHFYYQDRGGAKDLTERVHKG